MFLNHREDHITYSFKQSLPVLLGGEFAQDSSDLGESIDEPIEQARGAICFRKRAAEHFEDMLSGFDGMKGAGQIGRNGGDCGFRGR